METTILFSLNCPSSNWCYYKILIVFILFFTSTIIMAQPFAGGSGTAEDPYQIATAEQLNAIRGEYLDDHYIMTADIDLSSYGNWNPIAEFTGSFDGANHSISNLTVSSSEFSVGLFGTIGDYNDPPSTIAEVKNLTLVNVDVSGSTSYGNKVGALAGNIVNAKINKCSVSGSVSGGGNIYCQIGGCAGDADNSEITEVSFNGSVSTNSSGASGAVLGIASNCTVSKCSSTGSVTGQDNSGGLCGEAENSTIEDSHTSSSVSGYGESVGGFLGRSTDSNIDKSFANGTVNNTCETCSTDVFIGSPSGGTTTNSFYDKSVNAGTPDNGSAEGKTTEQMKTPLPYLNAGFDPAIWYLDVDINNGYPGLLWEYPAGTPLNNAMDISVEQINDNTVDPAVEFSTKGITTFTFIPDDDGSYFNIFGETNSTKVWIVQNKYLPYNSCSQSEQNLTCRFDIEDFGLSEGEELTNLDISGWASSAPITLEPDGLTYINVPVTPLTEDDGGLVSANPPATPSSWAIPAETFEGIDVVNWEENFCLPDIDLDNSTNPPVPGGYAGDEDACGPGSAAQCTDWLSDNNSLIDITDDLRTTMQKLSSQMDRSSPVTPQNYLKGILDYIDSEGLQINVRFQSVSITNNVTSTDGETLAKNDNSANFPSWDWMKDKLSNGEAVSMLYYYQVGGAWNYHYVSVAGMEETTLGRKHIKFMHDLYQNGSGGTVREDDRVYIDGDGCMLLEKRAAFIGMAVAQGAGKPYDESSFLSASNLAPQPVATHVMCANTNGNVFSWGNNTNGKLGDNTSDPHYTPIEVLKGEYSGTTYLGDNSNTKMIKIAGGYDHSIALSKDGTVYTWGSDYYGQLGDASSGGSYTPVRVVCGAYSGAAYLGDDPNNTISSVMAGQNSSVALADDGTVYTWGRNNFGQLGNNSNTTSTSPVRVVCGEYSGTNYLGDDPNNKIIAIAAGAYHMLALAQDGTVYAWGSNYRYGMLGINSTVVSSYTPVKVLCGEYSGITYLGDDSNNKIIAIAGGNNNSAALAEDGTVYIWGDDSYEQLGNGSNTASKVPIKVIQGEYNGTTYLGDNSTNKIIFIALGYYHSIALAEDGTVFTWGRNNYGQLGNDNISVSTSNAPIKVVKGEYSGTQYLGDNASDKIISVALGQYISIALAQNGNVYSWGTNSSGQLGNNSVNSYSDSPVLVHGVNNTGTLALPVTLQSFLATSNGIKIQLIWQTATEVNNYGFTIERKSEDVNREWEEIGFVEGHGNSNSLKEYSFIDTDKLIGPVQYRLKQIDINGGFEYSDIVEVEITSPKEFKVSQNYPNPFNPSTIINYSIPEKSQVQIKVYDILGSEVATLVNETQNAGYYDVSFNATNLSNGIYFYKIQTGNFVNVKKMLLLK